jgi:hypothetical protein
MTTASRLILVGDHEWAVNQDVSDRLAAERMRRRPFPVSGRS